MNLNKVFILGRLTANPDLRTMPGGGPVITLGVATNRTWMKDGQKQEEAEFHSVVIFGKQAEVAASFLQKGSLVLFEGRLRTRAWKDKGGNERKTTEIICEHMQLGPGVAKAPSLPQQASLIPATGPKELAEEERIPADGDEDDTGRNFDRAFGDQQIKTEDIPF
jgi:single stranded DNA-binding protein